MTSTMLILCCFIASITATDAWALSSHKANCRQTSTPHLHPPMERQSQPQQRKRRRYHSSASRLWAAVNSSPDSEDDNNGGIDPRWEQVLQDLEDAKKKQKNRSLTDDNRIQSARDLREELRQQVFEKTPTGRNLGDRPYMAGKDFPLNPNTWSKLQDILGEDVLLEGMNTEKQNKNDGGEQEGQVLERTTRDVKNGSFDDVDDDDDDGVFLDDDAYLNYSKMQLTGTDDTGYNSPLVPTMPQETLRDYIMPPDASYDINYYNNDKKEPTFEDILQLQQSMVNRPRPSPEEEKAIFEKVFAGEESYLEESELFRQGLTNKTAAEEATRKRRGQFYRKNLLEELNRLEQQIQEFEVMLQQSEPQKKAEKKNDKRAANSPGDRNEDETKSKGDMTAGPKSVRNNKGTTTTDTSPTARHGPGKERPATTSSSSRKFNTGESSSSSSLGPATSMESNDGNDDEWILVEDPDTRETFYWNSASGEMKWVDGEG